MKNTRGVDYAAGAALVTVGALTLLAANGYERGTLRQIGPGWFPMLVAATLVVLGMIVGMRRSEDPAIAIPPDARPHSMMRAAAILGAIAAFALLIERAGLLIAAPVTVVVAAGSERRPRAIEVMIRAVALTLLVAVIFDLALGMPIAMWPPGVLRR